MIDKAHLNVTVAADGRFIFVIEGVVTGSERGEFGMTREDAQGLYVRLGKLLDDPKSD